MENIIIKLKILIVLFIIIITSIYNFIYESKININQIKSQLYLEDYSNENNKKGVRGNCRPAKEACRTARLFFDSHMRIVYVFTKLE